MRNLFAAASTAILIAAPGLALSATFDEIDANNDGVVSAEEYSARQSAAIDNEFSEFDTNGDGMASVAELANISPTERYRYVDSDQDGQLTYAEFRAWRYDATETDFGGLDTNGDKMLSAAELANVEPGEAYRHVDTDTDGELSRDEYRSWRSTVEQSRFSNLDVNGDGSVSVAEMANSNEGTEHE